MRILIVGCSFSEDINLDNTTSWSYRLRNYLKNRDVEIVNLSYPGQGNGTVADKVIEYTTNNHVDLCLIQWTAFTRMYNIVGRVPKRWFKYKGLDWVDYGDNLDLLSRDSTEHSLLRIIETQNYLQSKGINYKMWFGWQQIYPEQIEEFKLTHLIEQIRKDDNFMFFHQDAMYDTELVNYGLFTKSNYMLTLKKLFGLDKGEGYYPETDWGGMSEYVRMNLNEGRYISKYDSHHSSEGHRVFFEGVIKPLFEEINESNKLI